MTKLSALTHLGLAKEVTQGTYVVPAVYFPCSPPKVEDLIEAIVDEALDADATLVRGVYQGVKDSMVGWDGWLFDAPLGHLFVAMGLADTVSGVGPYTHTLKQPASGAQPPTYSITDFGGVETRGFPGQAAEELNIKIDARGAVAYSIKWRGWPSATQATPTPSFPVVAPFLAWQAALTVAAVASDRLLSADITLKRKVEAIHTLRNNQAPREMWAGPLEADWKLKALFESTTDLNQFLNNSQPSTVLSLTQPAAGPVLTLTTTKAAWHKAAIDRGGDYVVIEAEAKGVKTTTDGGPMAAVLTNSQSTAY